MGVFCFGTVSSVLESKDIGVRSWNSKEVLLMSESEDDVEPALSLQRWLRLSKIVKEMMRWKPHVKLFFHTNIGGERLVSWFTDCYYILKLRYLPQSTNHKYFIILKYLNRMRFKRIKSRAI